MAIFVVMMALSAVAIFLYPKKYESGSTLFVRLGRSSASMDTATVGQTISIQESREAEMNSIVNLMESRGLAERVVQKIGYERMLTKYAWVEKTIESMSDWTIETLKENVPALEEGPSAEGSLSAEEIKAAKAFEEAVADFTENLKIDSPKKSTTIQIEYRARTPELAHDVVQAVLDVYQEMHITAYQSGGAVNFFEEQFKTQGELVAETENELRETKNEYAIVTMAGKQASLQTEFTETKKLMLETRADLDSAIAQAAKFAADLKKLPTSMLSQRTQGIAENATDAMKDRLNALEVEEKELAAQYVSTHPQLVKVREQIRMAREIVDAQPNERAETVIAVNPIWMDIENKLLVSSAEVEKLKAKVASLESQEKELEQRLNTINDLEVKTFEMQRKIDIARLNYMDYARKREEARINAALDKESLSNVSVVNPPTIRYKHSSPKRIILALLGLIMSTTCAIGTALGCDYLSNAKEMKAIRDAERNRYLKELEQEELRPIPVREVPAKNLKASPARERVLTAPVNPSPELDGDRDEEETSEAPNKAR